MILLISDVFCLKEKNQAIYWLIFWTMIILYLYKLLIHIDIKEIIREVSCIF
jgi:hypothetical protein